jgi:imidazolonepropionase-like amidohydrolase
VLLLPREIDELTDEIRQAGVAVVVPPVRPQDTERTVKGFVALGKSGVPLAFGGDAAELRNSAAWLVNVGLSRSTARRALIGQPSAALGLPQDAGRLLPGDPADFVVWTGDPLDTASRRAAILVQGQRVAMGAADDGPAADGRRTGATPARTRGRGR